VTDPVIVALIGASAAIVTTALTVVLGAWVRKRFGKATMPATWEEGYKRLTKDVLESREEIKQLKLYIEASDAAIRKQPYSIAREIIRDRKEYLAMQKAEMKEE
jgi:hypothetical protein